MKVILSVIFLALSLLYGVQGEVQCIKIGDSEDSFCGCQLQDDNGNEIINITLDFVDKVETHNVENRFTYTPCESDPECEDNAAVCKHLRGDLAKGKSIGSQDSATYTVTDPTRVDISVAYLESTSDITSVVDLVCDESKTDNGTFEFIRRDEKNETYYFKFSSSNFCIPSDNDTNSSTAMMSSTMSMSTDTDTSTMTPTMITTMSIMSTESSPTTPFTMSMPTMTTAMSNSMTMPASTNIPTMTTSMPMSMSSNIPVMNSTMSTVMPTVTPSMTSAVNNSTMVTSPIVTTTTNAGTGGNKDDEDRKVVLGVVLSIVGAIIIGVIVAIVVYFVWKKRKGASYEKIPTM